MLTVKQLKEIIKDIPDESYVLGDIVDGNSSRSTALVDAKKGQSLFGKPTLIVILDDHDDLY